MCANVKYMRHCLKACAAKPPAVFENPIGIKPRPNPEAGSATQLRCSLHRLPTQYNSMPKNVVIMCEALETCPRHKAPNAGLGVCRYRACVCGAYSGQVANNRPRRLKSHRALPAFGYSRRLREILVAAYAARAARDAEIIARPAKARP